MAPHKYTHTAKGGAPFLIRRRRVQGHTIYRCEIGANRTMHHDTRLQYSHNGTACHFHEGRRRKLGRRLLNTAVKLGALPLCYTVSSKLPPTRFQTRDGAEELRAATQTNFGLRMPITIDVGFASENEGFAFAVAAMRKYGQT